MQTDRQADGHDLFSSPYRGRGRLISNILSFTFNRYYLLKDPLHNLHNQTKDAFGKIASFLGRIIIGLVGIVLHQTCVGFVKLRFVIHRTWGNSCVRVFNNRGVALCVCETWTAQRDENKNNNPRSGFFRCPFWCVFLLLSAFAVAGAGAPGWAEVHGYTVHNVGTSAWIVCERLFGVLLSVILIHNDKKKRQRERERQRASASEVASKNVRAEQ